MATEQPTIKLRIDVDYPYENRAKSFLYVALGIKSKKSKSYLQNARVIAQMINESSRSIRAYWFFTPYTIPDKRLLDLLNPERHEVALHVATKPLQEWKILENETNRTVQYYTIHGTRHPLMRLLWGRKLSEAQASIPPDFPLKSFHDELAVGKTFSLDAIRYDHGFDGGRKAVEEWIQKGFISSIHPDWLFKAGSRRGPYYDLVKSVLAVDQDIENIHICKRFFTRVARNIKEYQEDLKVTPELVEKLQGHKADILTFMDRKWCCPITDAPSNWVREDDNVGLLEIKTYEEWWQAIGKKTRNMVRKAEKSGVRIQVAEPSDQLADGIWKIHNETPIRQERAFPHFGESLETVKGNMYAPKNNSFITATLDGEIVGFIQILFGDHIAIISNILAMQKHWDKSLNNSLLAKAVEVCALKGERWLMYGRVGNHPSLDKFKNSNGFKKYPISRIYVPLTSKGEAAIKLHMHRELKDTLPDAIKYPLIPALNWVSRAKVRAKLWLRNRH